MRNRSAGTIDCLILLEGVHWCTLMIFGSEGFNEMTLVVWILEMTLGGTSKSFAFFFNFSLALQSLPSKPKFMNPLCPIKKIASTFVSSFVGN